MLAKNTSKGPLRLLSGDIAPGDCGDFTDKEFKFLSGMGRAEEAAPPIPSAPPPYVAPEAPKAPVAAKKKAKKTAAPATPGFL